MLGATVLFDPESNNKKVTGVLEKAPVLGKNTKGRPARLSGKPSKLSLKRAQQDLNDRQLAYVMWAAEPEPYRKPHSQAELAKQLGVDQSTLWRWAKNPKVIASIRWMVLHNAGNPARVGRIIDLLEDIALDESQQTRHRLEAAREFLAAVGVKQSWKNPAPELLSVKEIDEMDLDALTDEEVWDLYNELGGGHGPALGDGSDDEVTEGEVVEE